MLQSGYVWQESSLLYHKNLTVKIVMPLQDYKAQYSVKINIYVFFSFIYFFFIEESGCVVPLRWNPRPPLPLMALGQLADLTSFISICTKKYFSDSERSRRWRHTVSAETSCTLAAQALRNQLSNKSDASWRYLHSSESGDKNIDFWYHLWITSLVVFSNFV